MREDEIRQNTDLVSDANELDSGENSEVVAAADVASDNQTDLSSDVNATSTLEQNNLDTDADADYSDDPVVEDLVDSGEENQIQAEFDSMDNVIDGKKRKARKRKKKLSKKGKMIEYIAIACVCVTVLSVVAYFLSMFIGGESPTQGLGGAELIVDMTDCDYYFGTVGTVDLETTFPGASNFKITAGNSKISGGTKLAVSDTDETFTLEFDTINVESNATATKSINCVVVPEGVNVATFKDFRKTADEKKIICLQDNIESEELFDKKRANYGGITIKNDVYGNGKTINLFEIVCSRSKASSKKYGLPYLQGNGKVGGETGISIKNKENGEQLIFQDVHVTGNDMSTEGPDVATDGAEGEAAAPTADGDVAEVRKGNMYGLGEDTINKRGVLLFSRYGNIVDISGTEDEKINVKVKHCLFENGGKVLHICAANLDLEGTIVRNAADTAVSIATYANHASYIRSSNNLIANSLTGGILFYCFDGNISEDNADQTWNKFEIVPGTFLDIYNWKAQDGLAFLPETEDFANIANPIAASEIPKASYNDLKGKVNGTFYIHFAIIKIRTGGGLPRNDSEVINYRDIGYTTARDNGFDKGFPIPGIASAIMKDIDVWGYYGNIEGSVVPGVDLADIDINQMYKELRDGRTESSDKK